MTGRRVKNKKAIYKYIDYFIKPFRTSLPAYLQDTTDVLNKIKGLNNIGTASFLVTMDVESLYTTIEREQGLAAPFLDYPTWNWDASYRIHCLTDWMDS